MKLLIPLLALVFGGDIHEEITGDEFAIARKEGATFIKFYAPWCGHCKKMAPAWSELANEINGDEEWNVRIGSVDCTKYKKECSENGVTGYPTVKLFLPDSDSGIKYQGSRTVDAIRDWLDEQLPTNDDEEGDDDAPAPAVKTGTVQDLTAANFKSTISGADKITFVKFFAPWCGHCKKMAPTWVDLAAQMASDESVVIAEVDCTQHAKVCSDNSVSGYPTLKGFKNGKEIEKYSGARDISGFKAALARWKSSGSAPGKAEKKVEAAAEKVAPSADDTLDLTEDTFAKTVAAGSTFVKFYAPWCGHCKKLAPVWDELATGRKNKQPEVKIAKVDCTKFNAICKENDVKGFPTLLFFQDGKNLGKHAGGRDLASLGKSINKFIDPNTESNNGKAEFAKKTKDKKAFVKFFAPWCGHCKKMAPAWKELEDEYKNNKEISVFDIDCTEDGDLCGEHGVKGYPTLKYYDVNDKEGEKYSGGRDLDSFRSFIAGKLLKPAEKDEL